MPKKGTNGGKEKVPLLAVRTEAEETRWFVGKSLLNGGNNLRPDLAELLAQLSIRVTQVVTNHGEPMICIRGPKNNIDALTAIAKGKVA